jgi:flagellar biosynthetic protein FliR
MVETLSMDALFGLFTVFVRCSAALMSSPLFGSQNTPVQIRVFTSFALSLAISVAVKTEIGHAPANFGALVLAFANEVAAGLIIGVLMQVVIQVAMMAGALLDVQIGLGMSQTLNPILGIPVSVLGQFKMMLGLMIFLAMNGHHFVIKAIINSYSVAPTLTLSDAGLLKNGLVYLLSHGMMLSVQIAAPVLGVSMIIDAALGVMAKALPSLQPVQIGAPVKLAAGIAAVSLCLPALVAATNSGVEQSYQMIANVFAR